MRALGLQIAWCQYRGGGHERCYAWGRGCLGE